MVAGGSALARDADGQVVFVDGALPGERVRVAVETEHRGYRTARLLEVIEPSPDRVAPPCPELARGCGACQWQHVGVEAQRSLKRDIVLDALRRIGGLDLVATAPGVEQPDGGAAAVVVPHDGAGRCRQRPRRLPPGPLAQLDRGRRAAWSRTRCWCR